MNIRVCRLPCSIEACGSDASPNGVWELNGPFDPSSMANRINARSRTRRCRRRSLVHVRSGGGAGLRGGGVFSISAGGARSGAPHFLLSFDEPSIMPWVEIKQCPTRSKVLDESHSDRVSSAGTVCRRYLRDRNDFHPTLCFG